jgi:hypothetical protein
MDFDIQEVITTRLVAGATVEEAYEDATKACYEHLSARLQTGEPFGNILRDLKFPDDDSLRCFVLPPFVFDEPRLYMVVAGGGIKNVPRAACMAERLKGNPNPSHADVEAAMAVCKGKAQQRGK